MSISRYCGSWLYFNTKTGKSQRFFCGHATCDRPECKKRFWLARIKLVSTLILEYSLDKFFTLTLDREMDVKMAWEVISGIWNKFLTIVRRKYPKWQFVAILECHKDGFPHIHGFTNQWMIQEEYSRHWSNCGGGKIAWVEKIKSSGDVADYVSKQLGRYVGKENILEGKRLRGKGQRTIWRSKGMKAKYEIQELSDWALIREKCFDENGSPLFEIENVDGVWRIERKKEKILLDICDSV